MEPHDNDVLITGVATATSLGVNNAELMQRLVDKQFGLTSIGGTDAGLDIANVGLIDRGHPCFTEIRKRGVPEFLPQVLIHTIKDLIEDAGIEDELRGLDETPIILGSCYGSTPNYQRLFSVFKDKNKSGLALRVVEEELYSLKFREDATTRKMQDFFGLRFAKLVVGAQCASSITAISLACSMIRNGAAGLVLVGAFDLFEAFTYTMAREQGLVDADVCKPFDKRHAGVNFADGVGFLVLESRKHCQHRGHSKVYGLIKSCSVGSYPEPGIRAPTFKGIVSTIESAMEDARLRPADFDLISAHANGLPDMDRNECISLLRVFGKLAKEIPIVSYVSNVGYSFAGSGMIDIAVALNCMRESRVIAPLFPESPMDAFSDFNFATGDHQHRNIDHILKIKLSFNGTTGALVISRFPQGE